MGSVNRLEGPSLQGSDLEIRVRDVNPRTQILELLKDFTRSQITGHEQYSRGDGEIRENHHLEATDFGQWVLGKQSEPNPKVACTMSCYEIILYAAHRNESMSELFLKTLYAEQRPCKWMDEVLCKEKAVLHSADPKYLRFRPKPGDLILFGDKDKRCKPSTSVHVVTAVGNQRGPIEVISHHNGRPQMITLSELCEREMTHLNGQEMVFSTPQWANT